MAIEKKFRRDANTETQAAVDLFFDREKQALSYLDRNRMQHLLGEKGGEVLLELGTEAGTDITKLEDTYDFGGVKYDSYRMRSWTVMTPQNTFFVIPLGIIYVDRGLMYITSNKTNIVANDTNTGAGGLGGFINSPTGVGVFADDSTDVARSISTVYVNQDNALPGLGIEYNGMYIISYDGAAFEGEVYVDLEFIVEQGAEIEFFAQ